MYSDRRKNNQKTNKKNYTFKEMLIIISGLYFATRHCEDIPAGTLTNDQNVVGGACSLLELK